MNTIEKELIINELYQKGYSDARIGKEIGKHHESIRTWRKKNNFPSNYKQGLGRKIPITELKQLVEKGLTDKEIAEKFNVKESGIYAARIKNSFYRENYNIAKMIEATPYQKSMLYGTLLGDSSLRIGKNCINPDFVCGHGIKQQEYAYHKYEILKSLGAKFKYRKRNTPDSRNGIYYEGYWINCSANPYYLKIYNQLYLNNKKCITKEYLDNFDEVSLTYFFMDDGSKQSNSVSIATCCFNDLEIKLLINFMKERFNLTFTKFNNNSIYLSIKDFKKFVSIIFPELLESMYYKINLQVLKSL